MIETSVTSFGTIQLHGNTHVHLAGSNNTGLLLFNANLVLHAVSCGLVLAVNKYSKFYIEDTDLKSMKSINTRIYGRQNDLTLDNNRNIKINGQYNKFTLRKNRNARLYGLHNVGDFQYNSNFETIGNDGNYSCIGNTNTKIFGNGNTVNATKNRNLKIKGNNNQLTISGTELHAVTIAPENNNENSILIRRKKYIYISYVENATIQDDVYNLGIFKFNMTKNPGQIQLTLDKSELDKNSYALVYSSTKRCTIQGSKNGSTQVLSVLGPFLTCPADSNVVFVDLHLSSRYYEDIGIIFT